MSALTRRQLLMAGAGAVALAACYRGTATADPTGLVSQIGDVERDYNAAVGLFAVDLDSGRTLAHRENDPFALCSTFKTYAAARVLQRDQRGELSLDDRRFVDPAKIVANSPVTEAHAGQQMSLRALCEAALQRSDNTAANLLLETIGGPRAITEFARSIGDERTRLDRWEVELNSAIPGDPRDTTTPRAIGEGYRALLVGAEQAPALEDAARRQLESWMLGNTTSVRSLRAGLPAGWTSADKTGAGDYGSTNAVGIAYGPQGQRVLLSVLTRSSADDPAAEWLHPAIAEVTRLAMAELGHR